MGHGDTQHIILLPGSVNECFEFGWRAFDIAERMQQPVFVLSDLDFGMNQWMTEPFQYPEENMDRGKVLWEETMHKFNGGWGRYKDLDGDGIPWRTLPGNMDPTSAYFARGTGHDENARYTEEAPVWDANMARLKKKYETAEHYVPRPMLIGEGGAGVGIIAFGSTFSAIQEARWKLEHNHGLKTDFLRLRALPFTDEMREFIEGHERVYVVELNRDGQLHQLLKIEYPEFATRLTSVAFNDGLPPTAKWVRESILAKEERQHA
jgi:2-oxoglutarate ferredoxin oxidoreductase subunit alpha